LLAGLLSVFFFFVTESRFRRAATVGAPFTEDLRSLSHVVDASTSSSVRFETTDLGATLVTSTFSLANSSRCLSSSHSFPLGDLPLMRTSAHSPNIFLPISRKVSFPPASALTGSFPGSTNSHVPVSQMITFPAP